MVDIFAIFTKVLAIFFLNLTKLFRHYTFGFRYVEHYCVREKKESNQTNSSD